MGTILTQHGLRADPDKIKAIDELSRPTSIKELKRFLGMVSYLSKFLPSISTITENLR